MKNVFFMPLRSGSKGIPGKNYKSFYGKPLFSWYLETVIYAHLSDEFWVATDCEIIKSLLEGNYPDIKIFNRSIENAKDVSPTIDVVLEFLSSTNFSSKDNFILIQATSPLTSENDIKNLVQEISKDTHDSYIACTRLKRFRWSEEGIPLDYAMDKKPRRQDYKGFLVECVAFYASKVGLILATHHLVSGNIGIIELGNEAMIDIDEPVDWKIGEAYMEYIQNRPNE